MSTDGSRGELVEGEAHAIPKPARLGRLFAWLRDAEADDSCAEWSFAQKGLLAVLGLMLAHNTIGFVSHPDFSTGAAASTEEVLWVEFNGWHAVAGYLIALPALITLLHARWAVAMSAYAAVAVVLSGLWILIDRDTAGFVPFGDAAVGDAIYHFTLGAAFGMVALIGFRRLPSVKAARR